MAIKYRGSNSGGSYPQYVQVVPKLAFAKHALLKPTSSTDGDVKACWPEAASYLTRPLYLAEEAATGAATPALVRAIPLSPDMYLDVECGALPVNGALIDVSATGEYGSALATGAGGVANGKLRVVCRNPDDTASTSVTTTGAVTVATSSTWNITGLTGHGLKTGDCVFFNGGTAPSADLGAGAAAVPLGHPFFVIWVDANTFRLASSLALAFAGTQVQFSAAGTTPTLGYYADKSPRRVIAMPIMGGTIAS